MKPENKPLCIGLGEVLFDLLPDGPKLGGAPANFAYAARALGMDGRAVSAVGDDELGKEAARLLSEKGLPAMLPVVDRPTGNVLVTFHGKGIPSYEFAAHPAYECVPYTEELQKLAAETEICCFGTMAQWGAVTHKTILHFLDAMKEDSLRIFDVNLRGHFYNKEIIEQSLRRANAVKCNEQELPLLAGYAGLPNVSVDAYQAYLEKLGVHCFMYTEGAKQSTVYYQEEKSILPTPKGDVVDTVGAGDSFTAVLIVSLHKGLPLAKAHARAVKVSTFVCTQHGGMPDYGLMKK